MIKAGLLNPERFALEPALKLIEGTFHTGINQDIFGAIGDSAPDRWGRFLMRRAENGRARSEKETARTLSEADYLLAVNDELRQGALRFSEKIDGEFLSPKDKHSIPPLVDLPKLLAASDKFIDDKENGMATICQTVFNNKNHYSLKLPTTNHFLTQAKIP